MALQPVPAAVAVPAVPAPAGAAVLKGYLSAWTQECGGPSCALPVPGARNEQVELALDLPQDPGAATTARVSRALHAGEGADLQADIIFYAVCPYGGASGTCAGRYFQAQVTLSGPSGAFCAASLNEADFSPFPVLMCAGISPAGKRFGITLHRQPL
jgi:hypothetical protein